MKKQRYVNVVRLFLCQPVGKTSQEPVNMFTQNL